MGIVLGEWLSVFIRKSLTNFSVIFRLFIRTLIRSGRILAFGYAFWGNFFRKAAYSVVNFPEGIFIPLYLLCGRFLEFVYGVKQKKVQKDTNMSGNMSADGATLN